jgi:hypothetical protein
MSFDLEKLYSLLPAIYRIRDAEKGGPLKELISVIAGQIAVLEENLNQLYDDQFIETCSEWVIPYLGDLIGYYTLNADIPKTNMRAEVANTIRYRRRKGTASMLEQLARDVTGWNARVVEFFALLASTQYMKHIRPENTSIASIRDWEPLERLNTPFNTVPHTVDVRRIKSKRGYFNIPHIGIFLWRLHAYPLTQSDAFPIDKRCFLFSPLGNNTQLFTMPQTEDEISHIAEPVNVPAPLSRRILDRYLNDYYGKGKSIFIEGFNDVSKISICDLSEWPSSLPAGKEIALDPVLGRFYTKDSQNKPPAVDFHYAFSADIGGGEYERASTFKNELLENGGKLIRVPDDEPTIKKALNALAGNGVIEITDSRCYEEKLMKNFTIKQRIELRAANGKRPSIKLKNDFIINNGKGGEFYLNGLCISGGKLSVKGELDRIDINHCTLVPGISLLLNGEPEHPDTPCLEVKSSNIKIVIDNCITGGIRVGDYSIVTVNNSIIDSNSENNIAYDWAGSNGTGGELNIENCTIIGKVRTFLVKNASNTIFYSRTKQGDGWDAPVISDVRQDGCMRYSFIHPDALTPQRYHCQPDTVVKQAAENAKKVNPNISDNDIKKISEKIIMQMKPVFSSLKYGAPEYAQLHFSCPDEIRSGADDESETGVFHDLYQPQREMNLNVRLEEYLRFGLEAGIFYES